MELNFLIKGNIVDIFSRKIFPGIITVKEGKIVEIKETSETVKNYILPGLIDSHIHIESSMLIPSEFARIAVTHGTVATVSDPHEIANVLGMAGIQFMMENGKLVPFKFYFGAPSCVPATAFESTGSEISPEDIWLLFKEYGLKYLSEMMNYPGVIYEDPVVMEKIMIAKEFGKPIDGHAPGLKGEDVKKYINAGITTDHECFTIQEALEKISYGMKILIREGSAAKNYEALHTLIKTHNNMVMFGSDDKHPDDLIKGHINELVKRSLKNGYDLFDILNVTSLNPVKHYNLEAGLLRRGDWADFIVIDEINSFNILQTYINGLLVAENGETKIDITITPPVNNFITQLKTDSDFCVKAESEMIKVIEVLEGQLVTNELIEKAKIKNGYWVSDIENDILKISVINRYTDSKPAIGFIKNFGIKEGAIASSVAHDSHNIIAVGVNDSDLSEVVNVLIKSKGGIAVKLDNRIELLPLPFAGIMSNEDGYLFAEKYSAVNKLPAQLGCKLHAPFMTLSFMALLVIPALKLSDKGLFDGNKFQFTELSVK
jgi:adenine deaminase